MWRVCTNQINHIQIRTIKCLSKFLQTNHTIKVLNLRDNGKVGISEEEQKRYNDTFENNETTSIRIDPSEYTSLFEALKTNKGLEKLMISFNVTNESMLTLADALRINTILKEIKIDSSLDKETIDYLADAIKANVGLQRIKLCCNTNELTQYFRSQVKEFVKIDFYVPKCYARLC